MNLKLSNQTIELDTQKLTEEDKKKLIEALEDNTWPKKGDEYFYIDAYSYDSNSIGSYGWCDNTIDQGYLSIGNIFRTKQEAEKHLTYLKALQVLKGDTKGYEWKYREQDYGYVVTYSCIFKTFHFEFGTMARESQVRFRTEEDAKESVKLHEKEWRIVLLGEDK
jgi:hypothetical protein